MTYPECSFKPKDYARVSMLAKQCQEKIDIKWKQAVGEILISAKAWRQPEK